MLAYNLSPSFNWDTTGLSDDEMRRFPEELGKLGFVFNFITYGGHQIDGLAAEEFATALRDDGMLALARLQRKFRLLESPYRTPQSLVGGDRLRCGVDGRLRADRGDQGDGQGVDAAPAPRPDRGADQRCWRSGWRHGRATGIGRGGSAPSCGRTRRDPTSSSFASWTLRRDARRRDLRQHRSIVAAAASSRSATRTRRRSIRRRRLMTLVQLFLIHRYHAGSVHYLTPTEDNLSQTQRMKDLGIFTVVRTEIGQIIVADVDRVRVAELVLPRRGAARGADQEADPSSGVTLGRIDRAPDRRAALPSVLAPGHAPRAHSKTDGG